MRTKPEYLKQFCQYHRQESMEWIKTSRAEAGNSFWIWAEKNNVAQRIDRYRISFNYDLHRDNWHSYIYYDDMPTFIRNIYDSLKC